MQSKSNNIKFTSYNDANEVGDKLFESLRSRYQDKLETSMRGGDFIFDLVQLMYEKCHKVNFRHGGSYIDSPDQIKRKKATINQKNKDDKCFQYEVTVALKYEETESHPERVSNIQAFINKYYWEEINNPSKIDDQKTSDKYSPASALNLLYIKEKEICPADISNINSNCEKQIILLMIPNEEIEVWHYIAVKKLSTLLRSITSKHHGDFIL